MNKFEQFACGIIFHGYPDNKSFDEIKELCIDKDKRNAFNDSLEETDSEDQQLDLCEKYENECWENIPTLLEDLMQSAKYSFGESQ